MSTSALRVLLISHGLPPTSVGGVEQHVEGLTRALLAMGHEVHVFTRSDSPGSPQGTLLEGERIEAGGRAAEVTRVVYRHEGIGELMGLYRCPVVERAFAGFLGGRDFYVAHVHHLTGLSTGLLDLLAQSGVPTVMTLHDYWTMCPRGQMWHRDETACDTVEPVRCADCLAPGFAPWIPENGAAVVADLHDHARQLLSSARLLIVPSARARPPFEALGIPAERIRVVENGVDTAALGALSAPDVERPGPLRLGYLGTLIPSKGLHILVEAIHRLPAGTVELTVRGNAVPYHGDGTYLTRVFGQLSPGDAIVYGGPYQTGDLPEILAEIDVVIAPALWREAFGLTVREALAAGRPVVVSRIGGLQDAIEDGNAGRVVEPGDVAGLAAVLAGMARDRAALAEMVRACRRSAPRGFAEMADELVGLYRSVAALD